jgi:hypothetical protein
MTFSPKTIFQRSDRYEGVRPINIYLLRLLYILMFFVLGKETWTHIFTHHSPIENATDDTARNFLQGPLASPCRLPTLVQRHVDRLPS